MPVFIYRHVYIRVYVYVCICVCVCMCTSLNLIELMMILAALIESTRFHLFWL